MTDALRLSDGRSEQEGRLEVCQDGEWGTICNNPWSMESTTVACRQLGLGELCRREGRGRGGEGRGRGEGGEGREGERGGGGRGRGGEGRGVLYGQKYVIIIQHPFLLAGNKGYYLNVFPASADRVPIQLANVVCNGTKHSLSQCSSSSPPSSCTHIDDVKIVCIPPQTPPGMYMWQSQVDNEH